MICETTGVTYNQLLTYLDNNNDLFTIFQPVQAVYYNETELSRTVDTTSTQLQNRVKVPKKDSFWFVSLLVQQLNTYGADTESFLDIYGNAYQYVVSEDRSPEVISWEGTSSLNSVYQWYVALDQCYQGVFGASDNAEAFLTVRIMCFFVCFISFVFVVSSGKCSLSLIVALVAHITLTDCFPPYTNFNT